MGCIIRTSCADQGTDSVALRIRHDYPIQHVTSIILVLLMMICEYSTLAVVGFIIADLCIVLGQRPRSDGGGAKPDGLACWNVGHTAV